jgi:RNase P subunit RPR2
MAIKVLRHKDSIFPIQITCKKCGTLLEIGEVSDLKIEKDQDENRKGYVKCLDCGEKVFLYLADQRQALEEKNRQSEWRG